MKKFLLVLPIMLLAAACNSSQQTTVSISPTLTPTPVSTVTPTPTSTVSQTGRTYTSHKLGISFSINPNFTEKLNFQESGNIIKICTTRNVCGGEQIQVFTKTAGKSLGAAVQEQILSKYPNCIEQATDNNSLILNTPTGQAVGAGMDVHLVEKICPLQYVPYDHSAFFMGLPGSTKFVFVNNGQDGFVDSNTIKFFQ